MARAALWPQKHCVYCKCRDCGFCPVSPPPLIAGLGAPERLRLRGHQLFWPSGAPAVLTGFNMQFQHGGRFGEPRVWDELLFRTLPRTNVVRMVAVHWGDSNSPFDCRSQGPAAAANGYLKPGCLEFIDKLVQWVTNRGAWLILAARCAEIADEEHTGRGDGAFADPTLQTQFTTMWRTLAARYRSTPRIAAYELRVGAAGGGGRAAEVNALYAKTCMAVRAADPSTPCMVGATRFYNRNRLQALPDASGVLKDAVIYAFNFYVPRPSSMASQRTRCTQGRRAAATPTTTITRCARRRGATRRWPSTAPSSLRNCSRCSTSAPSWRASC